MNSDIQKYAEYLNNLSGNVLLGCDGFVDETYEIVEERKSLTEFTAIEHLKQFGELLVDRADGGVGVELVPKRRCEGGFGINSGRIAAILGLKPRLPGLYGKANIDPAFAEFEAICELHSLGDPALTIAIEFGDGKLLMTNLEAVSSLTWADFEQHFSQEQLKELFSDVDLLGLGYWSLTADFDGFFQGFMKQYETLTPPRRMFFDFADIKKKSSESFVKSLKLIESYNSKIPMTFSLNEHEVLELCSRIGIERPELNPATIGASLKIAREKIGFDELVVHTPEFAAASSAADGEAYAIQERQTNVIRSAGAGDSFNGGYMCASLGDLPIKERLVMANAATAFFVTHATGPTKEELIAQIEKASDK
ncbi:PfkB family carbohydrate kinase [Coraliomargarita sp. SDUM461004]|uniref:PfkB family carbohydrate kinase n=1 Tax=Thalassobacterium sedimentorum TaxID=3041258 RepID=A0ABU1AIU7_9BACT|nr:PfkB family carbohydrate kinase [Coraliomargarita sp. SDUM461004]MDQ8194554.1 PfkB family carbohydrate kinase [Coraliomargarita sp. SDUM461004]